MKIQGFIVVTAMVMSAPLLCKADPFGAASAYNMIALGTTGPNAKAGTISGSRPDVTGRIAAADTISTTGGTTIGSNFNGDPYGSASDYVMVAGNGYGSGTFFINGAGKGSSNAFGNSSGATLFFNNGGHLVPNQNEHPSIGLDFNSLRTSLDNQSTGLGKVKDSPNTKVWQPETGAPVTNQDWLVLQGTDPGHKCPCTFVFNIKESEFNSSHAIDIEVPVGSTAIVNVSGVDPSLGQAIFYNGSQHSSTDTADDRILFNFPDATSVTFNNEISASVLAPFAYLSGTSQLDGNIIAAQIGSTGEVHNNEFVGELPPMPPDTPAVPEPGTLALVGTGILSVAGAMRRKKVSKLT